MSWGERGQRQTLNYLSHFSCSSNRACLLVSSSRLRVWCGSSFRSSFQNGGHNFQLSSHRRVWYPTACLYLVVSCRQSSLFQFSIPCSLLTAFPLLSHSANQNSLPIGCWRVSTFNSGDTYLFSTLMMMNTIITIKFSKFSAKLSNGCSS